MTSVSEFVYLIIYPLQKLFILLGSIQIFGMSLLSLLAAALIISVIFRFFVGDHAVGSGEGMKRIGNAGADSINENAGTTKYHHGDGD